MIHLDRAIIVEGKYDKIKLSSIFDAPIIVTGGFSVYHNKETEDLIRFYAENGGIIILTDSDRAGFQIRNHIKGLVDNNKIVNVYIPEIYGKEKRKDKPSKEGTVGVEGIDKNVIIKAFEKSGALSSDYSVDESNKKESITNIDLFNAGLTGQTYSRKNRIRLLKSLDLPCHISTSAMLEILNKMMTRSEFLDKYMND